MSAPRLLDLFCGAGGAAMGYSRAGFEVVGVDINPQPHYPFEFHQADALWFMADRLEGYGVEDFDAIPFTTWVQLCGSSFGLDLRRHRIFETGGFDLMLLPPCAHGWQTPRFRSLDKRRAGKLASVVGVHGHVNYTGEAALRQTAMGIDWMTQDELAEAIPPAYTEWIGRQLLAAIARAA